MGRKSLLALILGLVMIIWGIYRLLYPTIGVKMGLINVWALPLMCFIMAALCIFIAIIEWQK